MKKYKNIYISFLCAAGVFLYLLLLALFFTNAQNIFGKEDPKTLLVPVMMLLLFIISASITGFLVLGKPIMLYLDGKKKEAFVLLFSTLTWLVFFLIGVMIVLMVRY